jgi:alkanesulfonate monooxygenase SsuD/methylene tetrahydromethanopterin reductase-like flavin-dependent oxidoreductase (luciferase family)
MDVGILLADVEKSVSAADHLDLILRQVEAAQRNGIKYIAAGQHFGYPDYRWLQPIPLFARLAAELEPDTRLATTILIAPLYHPVMLAEELATLDVMTRGQLTVGLAIGYLPNEFKIFNVPMAERGARLEETILLLRRLWSENVVSHDGQFWQVSEFQQHIAPIQVAGPPIWVGAHSLAGVRRAGRVGDAWLPPPKLTMPEHKALLAEFISVHGQNHENLGPQPLRREIAIGRDRHDALKKYEELVRGRYIHQAAYGTDALTGITKRDMAERLGDVVEQHVIAGTATDCVRQVSDIAASLKETGITVNPLITRATWPGMGPKGAVDYLDSLGKEFVPALSAIS